MIGLEAVPIVTKICNNNDENQLWKYQGDSWSNPPTPVGLIRSVKYSGYCIGVDYTQMQLTTNTIYLGHCHSSMFGKFEMPNCPEGFKLNSDAECEIIDDTPCGYAPCKNSGVCQNVNNGTTDFVEISLFYIR